MFDYLILFLFGLLIGSFLNVVVYRETLEIKNPLKSFKWLPPWFMGKSHCVHCHHPLSWRENIPLLSFLFLKGRCSYCQKSISWRYPVIELFTAIEFIWLYYLIKQFVFFKQLEGVYSLGVLVFWLFVFSLSFVLTYIDIKTYTLPDSLLLPAIFVGILRLFFTGRWQFLLAGAGLMLFYLSLYLITSRKGIGFGDVKLGFFIGVVLGWWQWILVATFIAFLTGAIVGVILIILKKKHMKSPLPFGPFLLLGMLITKLWGDYLWSYYLSLSNYGS